MGALHRQSDSGSTVNQQSEGGICSTCMSVGLSGPFLSMVSARASALFSVVSN